MKMKKLLTVTLLVLSPIVLVGSFVNTGSMNYIFEDGSITQAYVYNLNNNYATSITIPATVVYEYYDDNDRDDDGNALRKYRTCTVTRIGERAFVGTASLRSVTIENGLTSIGPRAFSSCSSLPSITIPDSVTSIGDWAFQSCTSLASVTIGRGVTSIGTCAFYNCTSLASVMIPSSVTSIEERAFHNCSSLVSVTIPNNVTSIGEQAFRNCSSLVSVTIPNNVMSIGERAFYNCSLLTSVTMPQSGIADRLNSRFSGSDGVPVRHLTLDATVSAIHENAFENCKVLTMIVVDAENEHYFVSPMDGCLYDRDQTTLLCCPRDKTSIDIPYGVRKIANNAFAYCSNLVSVSMPVTLKTIGENAFLDCASLPSVAIPDSVTNIGNCAFGNCRMLYGVTIPSSVQTLSTSAFNNCDILWTEWYRTLADFAVNGRAFDLTQQAGDRAIADVTVSGDMSLDTFVLKEGKVYDSVLYIKNNADHAVRVTLPSGSGNMSFHYQTFKGATPLTLPAYSQSILTITRVAGGNVGGNVFLVTREELETVQ